MKLKINNFVILYFCIYAGFGSVFTLLGKHLHSIGLNQNEIGTIFSVSFIVMLVSQPIWGYLADKYKNPKKIIYLLLIGSSAMMGLMMNITNYSLILALYCIGIFFISPIAPILDSILMRSTDEFGNIRKWGSIGYAVSALIAGVIAQKISSDTRVDLRVIFILYVTFSMISLYFISKIKATKETIDKKKKSLTLADFKQLMGNKKYILFLLTAFSLLGSLSVHGNFFPIYYGKMGQSLFMTTIVIFLFTMSEAPIMSFMDKIIKKYDVEYCLIISTILFSIRWFFYGVTNSPILILIFFVLHGITVGSFFIVVPKFINENVNENVKTSAMAIYSAFASGIGAATANKIAGGLPEGNISLIYTIMGIGALLSLTFAGILFKLKKSKKVNFSELSKVIE